MNESWQEEPVFFCFFFPPSSARLVTCESKWGEMERKKKKVGRRREKKQLLKRSNTGEGDTPTSCIRCHGYQSPM